jgi:uncharacterized MnhB-related membrane protein
MWYVLIAVGILVCAILAIASKRLLISAIWLALTSALVALMIYLLGAPQLAVIELSVGAGLVTVLFVFAINIAGEEVNTVKSMLPKPLIWGSIVLTVALAAFLILRAIGIVQFPNAANAVTASILWDDRYVDLLLQVVLIFAGVLSVIGILSLTKKEPQMEDKA